MSCFPDEYIQSPARVEFLLKCFKSGTALTDGSRVVVYVNTGALYKFRFDDGVEELLDASSPDDTPAILAQVKGTRQKALVAAITELGELDRELSNAKKDAAMWKDEAENMARVAKRWAFYCAFAMLGGALLGYAARGVL